MLRLALYGVFGWCAEIVWTALTGVAYAATHGERIDPKLTGHTYLWMFPIYGGGGLVFEVVHGAVSPLSWVMRGLIYMAGCFVVEYASGWLIERATGAVPWDYSYSRWHVHGIIRLDYAPVWFVFGLLLEHVQRAVSAIEPALRGVAW